MASDTRTRSHAINKASSILPIRTLPEHLHRIPVDKINSLKDSSFRDLVLYPATHCHPRLVASKSSVHSELGNEPVAGGEHSPDVFS